jgi:hypothetical protein
VNVLAAIRLNVINETQNGMELEFDLIACDAPIANAIRRVLLAEVGPDNFCEHHVSPPVICRCRR